MSNLFKDLKNSSNLITGHINPDGDALGSALAFKLILDSKGVESDVCFDMKGNVPSNLNHLPIDLILDRPKKNYENVYVFDCGNSERLGDLEELALSQRGVIKAYALQAGRELRVIVESEKVSDDQAKKISYNLSKQIQEEMTYPGLIKIIVIRETRSVHVAK